MKQHFEKLLYNALKQLQEVGELPAIPAFIQIETSKNKDHGDFSSGVALALAKSANHPSLEIANLITQYLPPSSYIQKVEVKPPGFINFFLSSQALKDVIIKILAEGDSFGRSKMGRSKQVLVEFVSPDPICALNVAHGRYASLGVAIANLLDAVGFKVTRECYLKDTEQIKTITKIRDDLNAFNIRYHNWFSESQLIRTDSIERTIAKLRKNNLLYEHNDALYFRSTDLGDEKDRILMDKQGRHTNFAINVAYHLNKFERGFDIAIDILGANQEHTLPGVKAALKTLGINPERLIYLPVQVVTLYRRSEELNAMPLHQLCQEVGNDAARFFYLMRKYEQHMDFDLELAKVQSSENPVFYIQYAYARICSVFKQLREQNIYFDEANGIAKLHLLQSNIEHQLLNTLSCYPDIIIHAALEYEPHQLSNYLRELATDFHAYYNSHYFLVDDKSLRDARLILITAIRQILLNGFKLLGINAPEHM